MVQKIVTICINASTERIDEILLTKDEYDFGWRVVDYNIVPHFNDNKNIIYVVARFERKIS